jgi:hypothetical protein
LSPDGEVFLLTSPFIDRYIGQVPGRAVKAVCTIAPPYTHAL